MVLLASAKAESNNVGEHKFRSYHKKATISGIYRICLKSHKYLYKEVPDKRYEMSLQIEGLFEA